MPRHRPKDAKDAISRPSPRKERGTEAQHLDMLEDADPRGDDDLYSPEDSLLDDSDEPVLGADEMMANYNVDMSETQREGDEMSGDEHSSGLQGGEPEIEHQLAIDSGMPGHRSEHEEEEIDLREKRRMA
jgi:hypothetical protein